MLAIRILIRSPKSIRGGRILRDGVRGVIRLSTPEAVHLSAPIEQALLRENLADIINIGIEELVWHRYELPHPERYEIRHNVQERWPIANSSIKSLTLWGEIVVVG
jgi:hypothetical protein